MFPQIQFSLLSPAGKIMLTPIGHIIDTLVVFFIALKLYSTYRKTGNKVIGYFSYSFFSFVFMWLFMWTTNVMAPHDPAVMGAGIVVAHAFAYLGLAFFAMIPMYFIRPRYTSLAFVTIVMIGTILTIGNLVQFSYPVLLDFGKFSVTKLNQEGYLFGNLIPVPVILSWVFGGIYFLYKSAKKIFSKPERVQSLLLGIGFLALFAGGPIHLLVKTALQYFIIDIGFAGAHILVLYAIYYKGLAGPAYAQKTG